MIVTLKSKKKEMRDLVEVLENCNTEDFYVTENNQRVFVKDSNSLNKLLKNSHHVYFENEDKRKGIILVWKSFGGDKARQFIKIVADTPEQARGLLKMLLWNYNKELFVKLKKGSPFINIFLEKKFKFLGGRGSELLLMKSKFVNVDAGEN